MLGTWILMGKAICVRGAPRLLCGLEFVAMTYLQASPLPSPSLAGFADGPSTGMTMLAN